MKTKGIMAAKWLSGVLLAAAIVGCDSDSDSGNGNGNGPRTETAQGVVEGVSDRGMLAFKGIPYAEPPVGELRFAPPQPHAGWGDSVFEAKAFGNACLQPAEESFGETDSAEDCLYLNVYTPSLSGERPVMVWIHGGAFETGSGGGSYDPVRLVGEDVVVVTINYRVGLLGFLAHSDFADENEEGGSGSYGIMDQILALEWVRDNIAQFGGDPNNVTLFGESAGGHSVLTHVVSPESEGLFHKAIVQSGSIYPEQVEQSVAEEAGERLAEDIGCGDNAAACLRSLTPEQILQAQELYTAGSIGFTPNLRPDILPTSIAEVLATGGVNPAVPVLMGTNLDEWRLFVGIELLVSREDITEENYVPRIAATLGSSQEAAAYIASAYPLEDYNAPAYALSAIGTDAIFACNNAMLSGALAMNGVNTYVYEFEDRDAPSILDPIPDFDFDYGAAHAFEIQYVLASLERLRAQGMSEQQIALSEAMVDYWTNFARTGDPNSEMGDLTPWPLLSTTGQYLRLSPADITPALLTDYQTVHSCGFWGEFAQNSAVQ